MLGTCIARAMISIPQPIITLDVCVSRHPHPDLFSGTSLDQITTHQEKSIVEKASQYSNDPTDRHRNLRLFRVVFECHQMYWLPDAKVWSHSPKIQRPSKPCLVIEWQAMTSSWRMSVYRTQHLRHPIGRPWISTSFFRIQNGEWW